MDVVQTAVDRGFTHYGLSEHCPRDDVKYLYPEEIEAGPKRLSELFEAYVKEAREAQQAFADRMDVLVGFETERLPIESWAQRMQELRERHQPDFIIGSVHDVDGIWVDYSPQMTEQAAQACGGRDALHRKYFAALTDLVLVLRPEIIGHLDLVRKFDGPHAAFGDLAMREAQRALEAAASVGAVLDVNPGAHRRGLSPVYPLPSLLQAARRMGVGVTLGDDGHGPHDVGAGLDACLRAIADAGYKQVHYLAHRDGVVQWQTAAIEDVHPLGVGA